MAVLRPSGRTIHRVPAAADGLVLKIIVGRRRSALAVPARLLRPGGGRDRAPQGQPRPDRGGGVGTPAVARRRLVIAGGDTLFDYRGYRAQVLARAEELAVALAVLGPVAHDELPSLVAAAGVFAFPSTREGFGPAAMEALAAGVPLVARDLPVLREVYDGAARFAREPDELAAALAAALLRPDPALREAGRGLAARYTWEAAAHAHLVLYRSLRGRG